jgi:hypothetical protein
MLFPSSPHSSVSEPLKASERTGPITSSEPSDATGAFESEVRASQSLTMESAPPEASSEQPSAPPTRHAHADNMHKRHGISIVYDCDWNLCASCAVCAVCIAPVASGIAAYRRMRPLQSSLSEQHHSYQPLSQPRHPAVCIAAPQLCTAHVHMAHDFVKANICDSPKSSQSVRAAQSIHMKRRTSVCRRHLQQLAATQCCPRQQSTSPSVQCRYTWTFCAPSPRHPTCATPAVRITAAA